MPVISFTASMAAANPEAVPRKLRRDSLALAAQVSTRSLICSPMWPARKNEVPCSSGVIGPRVVRLYPLKYSKTLNSIRCLPIESTVRPPIDTTSRALPSLVPPPSRRAPSPCPATRTGRRTSAALRRSQARFSRAFAPRSESERQAHAEAVVVKLEGIVVLVALLVLVEIREVVADVQLESPGDRVDHRDPRVGVDLLEIHGAAFLAAAVDSWKAAPTDRRPCGEPRAHRDVEADAHDRHRQLLSVEVLVTTVPLPAELRVEVDVGQPDAARQERSVVAHQEPLIVEADTVEIGVDVNVTGTEAVSVEGGRRVDARTSVEEVIEVRGSKRIPRGHVEGHARLESLRHVDPEVFVKPQPGATKRSLPDAHVPARYAESRRQGHFQPGLRGACQGLLRTYLSFAHGRPRNPEDQHKRRGREETKHVLTLS